MRHLFFFILLMMSCCVYAQPSDFIALKKKGKTIRSYYSGTHIEFITNTGAYRNALINRIYNDTLYLQEFDVRRLPTTFGTYILDTAGSYRFKYHYNQVASLGPKKQGFNVSGSGASLMGGGVLLILASGVVYLADRDNFSPELLSAAAVLTGIGYLLNKSGSKGIVPGKKNYTLEYIDTTP